MVTIIGSRDLPNALQNHFIVTFETRLTSGKDRNRQEPQTYNYCRRKEKKVKKSPLQIQKSVFPRTKGLQQSSQGLGPTPNHTGTEDPVRPPFGVSATHVKNGPKQQQYPFRFSARTNFHHASAPMP